MLKTIIATTALLTAATVANAGPCEDLGGFAMSVAVAKDQGASVVDVIDLIDGTPEQIAFFANIILAIYKSDASPIDAYTAAVSACYDAMGELS